MGVESPEKEWRNLSPSLKDRENVKRIKEVLTLSFERHGLMEAAQTNPYRRIC